MHLALWEQLLLAVIVVLVLLWFAPGVKRIFAESREAEKPDWRGFLIPIAIVALFVVFLLMLVSG